MAEEVVSCTNLDSVTYGLAVLEPYLSALVVTGSKILSDFPNISQLVWDKSWELNPRPLASESLDSVTQSLGDSVS